MKYLNKSIKITFFILILLSLIDFFICRLLFDFGFKYDTKEFNLQRFSVPYIEFTGKPNALDHNGFGYRGKSIKDAPDSAFKILFFGGSTGYYGNPTIAQLLEERLKTDLKKDIFVANCAVVGSNHNQHMHALLEQFMNYKIDMIIFYGGYNENIQPLFYDPRPGYPFNFYYKNECPKWRFYLMKYSAICGEFEKRYRLISGIKSFRKKYEIDAEKWHQQIEKNYFETLEKSNLLSSQLLKGTKNGSCEFLGFYQPYKVPVMFMSTHLEIKTNIKNSNYLYDISACLDSIAKLKKVYAGDDVHLLEVGNEIVAEKISEYVELRIKIKDK